MGTVAHYLNEILASFDSSPRSDGLLYTQNRMPTISFCSLPMFKPSQPLDLPASLFPSPAAPNPPRFGNVDCSCRRSFGGSLSARPDASVISHCVPISEPLTATHSDTLLTEENILEWRNRTPCCSPAHRCRTHIPIRPL
jgi:hypothetical protein